MANFELAQLNKELYDVSKRLHRASKDLFPYAQKKAQAEQVYREELARAIVRLKDRKMPATLIPDLARGETAASKYARDLAEAEYTLARETLKAVIEQKSALQTLIRYQEDIEE